MKKRLLAMLLMAALVMSFSLSACGSKEEAPAEEPPAEEEEETTEEPEVDGSAYGYAGDDPVEAAVYKYLAEEVSKDYPDAEVHIPTVNIIYEDFTNEDEVIVKGDFWIDNYDIDGDTLKTASGGNHPGVMYLKKEADGNYTATKMDTVADGSDFDASAKELFGDQYEDFMKVYSDEKLRAENRLATVTDYVNLNGLDDIKYYQDEGWDPVELAKN